MLETIYTDFTTKLLPKIQEGLIITKDYFTDLFGRYIKYLIITDSMTAVITLAIAIAGGIMLYKGIKYGKKHDWDAGEEIWFIMFGLVICILGSVFFFISLANISKDIYIPEVRVFEKIQNFRSN